MFCAWLSGSFGVRACPKVEALLRNGGGEQFPVLEHGEVAQGIAVVLGFFLQHHLETAAYDLLLVGIRLRRLTTAGPVQLGLDVHGHVDDLQTADLTITDLQAGKVAPVDADAAESLSSVLDSMEVMTSTTGEGRVEGFSIQDRQCLDTRPRKATRRSLAEAVLGTSICAAKFSPPARRRRGPVRPA